MCIEIPSVATLSRNYKIASEYELSVVIKSKSLGNSSNCESLNELLRNDSRSCTSHIIGDSLNGCGLVELKWFSVLSRLVGGLSTIDSVINGSVRSLASDSNSGSADEWSLTGNNWSGNFGCLSNKLEWQELWIVVKTCNTIYVISVVIGGNSCTKWAVVIRNTLITYNEITTINTSTLDYSILECILESNLSWSNLLGRKLDSSCSCYKTSWASQLRSTLVGCLLSTQASRNHVTLSIGLTYRTVDENTSCSILRIEITILLTTYC